MTHRTRIHERAWLEDQADAALSSAAVPRVGLGPTTPPLCRCAERHADLIASSCGVRVGKPETPPADGIGVDGAAK